MGNKITTTKPAEQSKESLQLAFQVSDRVQLKSVRTMECAGKLISFPKEGTNSYDITATTSVHPDRKENTLFVFTSLVLYATSEDGSDLAKINAEFLLMYHLDNWEGLDENNFDHFAKHNGIFNAWPYWREMVQSMTSRLQLPSLTLGTHRFGMVLPESRPIAKKKAKPVASKVEQKGKKQISSKKKTKKKTVKKKTTKKAKSTVD